MSVEPLEVGRWDPKLAVLAPTDEVSLKLARVDVREGETGDVACERLLLRVPVSGDLDGVLALQHRIEDGLLGQARWKAGEATFPDENELAHSYRAPEDHRLRSCGLTLRISGARHHSYLFSDA